MADQNQACELLGHVGDDPFAWLGRKVEQREVLRFMVDGRAVYPLLQFDLAAHRIYPAMRHLLAMEPTISATSACSIG
ncbi:hypothetical protein SAMN06295912_12244 [Sphingomonas laterariae]|uniref:Uncharacterized protein n=1 Tax=Edaphosphingomonas laterariae TaxID=861865 RepID=A0A239I822_9SPHN|nr:hypothetical protein [Sphingomonas laterariae]SNS89707.1 hypothetical protein SAMN06295912_12244 [Sphingomonas laterariae]